MLLTYVCGTLVLVFHLPAHKRDTDADRHVKGSPVFKFNLPAHKHDTDTHTILGTTLINMNKLINQSSRIKWDSDHIEL